MGCSGQNDPYNNVPVVQLSGAQCMDHLPAQIHDYFGGSGTTQETQAIWGCMRYMLVTFSKYVQGPGPQEFDPNGLRNFLEKFFLSNERRGPDGHVISDSLLAEIMQVKRVFVGGSTDLVTGSEINRALTLIDHLQDISLELLPYARILFTTPTSMANQPTEDTIDHALAAFNDATTKLLGMMDPDQSSYTFAHMQTLFKDVHDFLQLQNPTATYGDISKYIPLFAHLKGTLFNSSSSSIGPSDWPKLGQMVGQLYGMWIRKDYYFSFSSLYHSNTLAEYRALLLSITGILKDACGRRANKTIPLSEVDPILKQVSSLNLLPPVFDEGTLQSFVHRLIDFILNPQNIYPQSGISSDKVDYLDSEVNSWADVQEALIDGKPIAEPAWFEMLDVLNTPWALNSDPEGRVIFDWQAKGPVNIESATRLNWSRELFNILFNAYVQDPTRRLISHEMSQGELHQAFVDLKPVLVMLGLIDASDTTFDQRLFRDAHLFMPKSDGSMFLTFDEGVDYVQYVVTGIDSGAVLTSLAAQDGARLGMKNCILPGGLLSETCFRSLLENDSAKLFSYMPGFRDYAGKLSVSQWQIDLDNIEKVVRTNGPSPKPMTAGEIDESFIMLQYIETLMIRFDTDHDGTLGPIETLNMLKLFGPTIASLLNINPNNNQAELEDVFTYIMRYKQLPNPSDPVSQLRFENWRLQRGNWSFSIDRGGLIQILAFLSSMNI